MEALKPLTIIGSLPCRHRSIILLPIEQLRSSGSQDFQITCTANVQGISLHLTVDKLDFYRIFTQLTFALDRPDLVEIFSLYALLVNLRK